MTQWHVFSTALDAILVFSLATGAAGTSSPSSVMWWAAASATTYSPLALQHVLYYVNEWQWAQRAISRGSFQVQHTHHSANDVSLSISHNSGHVPYAAVAAAVQPSIEAVYWLSFESSCSLASPARAVCVCVFVFCVSADNKRKLCPPPLRLRAFVCAVSYWT